MLPPVLRGHSRWKTSLIRDGGILPVSKQHSIEGTGFPTSNRSARVLHAAPLGDLPSQTQSPCPFPRSPGVNLRRLIASVPAMLWLVVKDVLLNFSALIVF